MQPTTLLILGAGLSVRLGLPTTRDINNIISVLLDYNNEKSPTSIDERLAATTFKWPKFKLDDEAKRDIKTTLSLLFDGNGARNIADAYASKDTALHEYISQFAKQVTGVNEAALKHHLLDLTQTYDLISLKSILYALKNNPAPEVDIVNILTAIHSSLADNISIPTKEIFPEENADTRTVYYCDQQRLLGALNAYKLLVYKIFKHLLRQMDDRDIQVYEDFFRDIATDYSGIDTLEIAGSTERNNYLSTFGYLTYNWDPVLPFLTANRTYLLKL
jgi:hypothetical protein